MPNLDDYFIDLFIISSCNLMMKIIIKIFQTRVNLALYMAFKFLSQHSFSFFAN